MTGDAFYFHFGLVTRKIYVTYFMSSLRKRISVFHDFPHVHPTYIVEVSVETKGILELVKQVTNTSTHKLKPKSSVHNFEMSETLLEERHFNLATKQEIK